MKRNDIILNKISTKYENNISKKRKKNFGIFYTDYLLAHKMIKELKISRDSIVLDPCCGTGVFLEAAKNLGCCSIYGCDIDRGAVRICNGNNNNAVVCDSIFNDPDKTLEKLKIHNKVDFIIGNPPFAILNTNNSKKSSNGIYDHIKKCGNNLYIGSIMQSIKMLKPKGKLCYIIPKNFLHIDIYSYLRKTILSEYDIVEIIDLGTCFKNVRGEQIILTIQKHKSLRSR